MPCGLTTKFACGQRARNGECIVENDQVKRVLALGNNVGGLVLGGKRDAKDVANCLQVINDHPDFVDRLRLGSTADTSKIREELILWQKFDQKFFPDVNVGNYTSLRIPLNPPAAFTLPIVNARGISADMLVTRMRKEFKVWVNICDLDSVSSDRSPASSSYIVLVRDRIEADDELVNESADMLAEKAISGITLPERLRLEFFYWWKTGQHLDLVNMTLASGSRHYGVVPRVCYNSRAKELILSSCTSNVRRGNIRSRAIIF